MRRADHRTAILRTVVAVAGAIGAVALAGDTLTFLAISAAVYSLLTLSLLPLVGGVGLLPLAQLMFAAIGAVVVAWLEPRCTYLVSIPVAVVLAAAAGAVVGSLSARLRGVNFAVATLSLAAAGEVVLSHATPRGFRSTDQVDVNAFMSGSTMFFAVCALLVAAVSIGLRAMQHSIIGHRWAAVRFSERAAAAAAVPTARVKIGAVGLSAGIAGLAGAMMVGQYGFLTVTSVAPINSLVLVAVAMVAGVDSVGGCIAAGVVAIGIPELFRRLGLPGDAAPIVFGVAAVLTLREGQPTIAEQMTALGRRVSARGQVRVCPPSSRPADLTDPIADPPAQPPDRVATSHTAAARLPALSVTDVTVRFGSVTALDRVNLTVPDDAVVGVIGPNGAGKSTLIDVVTGFSPHHDGSVLLGGDDLVGLPSWRRAALGLRRTFQQGRAVPSLTVAEYLRLAGGPSLDDGGMDRLVRLLRLPSRDTSIHEIDVVTRRTLEIGAALAPSPRVVLLDEPAAGLGQEGAARLAATIRSIPEQFGSSVLLVEHDVAVIRAACQSVYVLDGGRLIADGSPDEVLRRSDVVAAYLGHES